MKHLRRFNESVTSEYASIFTEFLEDDLGAVAIFDLVEGWQENGVEVYYFSSDQMSGEKVDEIDVKLDLVECLLTAGLVEGLKDGRIMDNPSKVICLVYNPETLDIDIVISKIIRKCGMVNTSIRYGNWGPDSLNYTKETILIF